MLRNYIYYAYKVVDFLKMPHLFILDFFKMIFNSFNYFSPL